MASTGSSRKIFGVVAVAALLGGCAASSGAGGGGAAAATVAPTPEMIAQGRSIYSGAGNCQTCHGANGAGGRFGPNLADATWLWVTPGSPTIVSELAELIRTGIPQPRGGSTPMPAMGGGNLSADQLTAVAAYVVSLSQ